MNDDSIKAARGRLVEAFDDPEFADSFHEGVDLHADTLVFIGLNSRTDQILFRSMGNPADVLNALYGALNTLLEQHPELKDS